MWILEILAGGLEIPVRNCSDILDSNELRDHEWAEDKVLFDGNRYLIAKPRGEVV